MAANPGVHIVRLADLEWEDRANVDGWLSKAGMYYDDPAGGLTLRLIDYPVGSTEPRHVHAGTHATTVLKGRVIVDDLSLQPLDVVVGPGNEPHGPLHYPDGCQLLSAFQGGYFHSEVEQLSGAQRYKLVQAEGLPWHAGSGGGEEKTLIEGECGSLVVQAFRAPAGTTASWETHGGFLAGLLLQGGAAVEEEQLGVWDMFQVSRQAGAQALITEDCLLLIFVLPT